MEQVGLSTEAEENPPLRPVNGSREIISRKSLVCAWAAGSMIVLLINYRGRSAARAGW
jgi:hypothetical protein